MNYLITGGAGFMGSHFVKHLLAKYPHSTLVNLDKLTYAGNPENLTEIDEDTRYTFVHGDITDRHVVQGIFENNSIDVVVNFAAETHVDRSILDARSFAMTDVLGTLTLLEAARKYSVEKYIQISTDETYGYVQAGKSDEQYPFKPRSPYAASKAGADHLVYSYYVTYDVPTIITHCCNNLGPNQYPEKLIPLFITNFLEGKKVPLYGDGEQVREWLFVKEHSLAVDFLIHNGCVGESYNIGSGDERTNKKVTEQILQYLNFPSAMIEYVKDRPGHDRRYAVDFTKIRALGWEPAIHFDEALQQTIAWYQQNELWWKKIKTDAFQNYYKQQYMRRV